MYNITVEEWLNHNDLAINVWKNKYRFKNESFNEWLDRISGNNPELKQRIFEKKFLFAGRTLSNRGTDTNASLSNCYSSGYIEDSLPEIMDKIKDLALTYKAQGGQGVSLSKLRPKGSLIKGIYESDGIVPFMELLNCTTDSISQGSSRRGALMISLDIEHKEAETFMTIKSVDGKINRANLSLEVSDKFMNAVTDYYNSGIETSYEVQQTLGNGDCIKYDITPIKLYKKMIEQAWKHAEPGVLFTERCRNYNLMEYCNDYQLVTSNPCGEQILPNGGSCNLSSINLSQYVLNPFTNNTSIDYNSLKEDIAIYVRAMDDIIDENTNNHPLELQREMIKKYRNMGIGIMGLADLYIKFGYKFGDDNSKHLTRHILQIIIKEALMASNKLAKERGTFPMYNHKVFQSEFFQNLCNQGLLNDEERDSLTRYGLRNCTLLSIAPTGSISLLFECSSGREPNFMLEYQRKTESLHKDKDVYYTVQAGIVKEYRKYFPDNKLPEYFVTAYDLDPYAVLDIQGILQEYIDTAISATLNIKEDFKLEDLEKIYLYAWECGCKGVTCYRENSRPAILAKEFKDNESSKKRPEELSAKLIRFKNGSESWIAFVGLKNDKPYEIFTGKHDLEEFPIPINITSGKIRKVKDIDGKRYDFIYTDKYGYVNVLGGLSRIFNVEYWNYAKLISALLRHETPLEKSIKIIDSMFFESDSLNNWKNGVCRALKTFIQDGTTSSNKCPDCGEPMIYESGCCMCRSCGHSKCN